MMTIHPWLFHPALPCPALCCLSFSIFFVIVRHPCFLSAVSLTGCRHFFCAHIFIQVLFRLVLDISASNATSCCPLRFCSVYIILIYSVKLIISLENMGHYTCILIGTSLLNMTLCYNILYTAVVS